ncbi:MAG: hypothetical protein A3F74_26985 [Betaproteobacteria bacterium RIFCSPLOWO2_12_FULL_62_58]|nr:MAG: hypothetical protein A3F74_26985 [Betaproteobacteria bacterium RIFCSPLOWO2_12_FULL_62_58]
MAMCSHEQAPVFVTGRPLGSMMTQRDWAALAPAAVRLIGFTAAFSRPMPLKLMVAGPVIVMFGYGSCVFNVVPVQSVGPILMVHPLLAQSVPEAGQILTSALRVMASLRA